MASPVWAKPDVLVIYRSRGNPNTGFRQAVGALAARTSAGFRDLTAISPSAPQEPQRLRRAIEAFHKLDYVAALRELDAAVAGIANTGARGFNKREISDLFVYRGHIYAIQSDEVRAWSDFTAAATVDPSRHLDAARFPPRVVETFGRASKAARSAGAGLVEIRAPIECTSHWDGASVHAGERFQTTLGPHYAHISCPGHLWGARVEVNATTLVVEPKLIGGKQPTATSLARRGRQAGYRYVLWVDSTKKAANVRLLRSATGGLITRRSLRVVNQAEQTSAIVQIAQVMQSVDTEARLPPSRLPTTKRFYHRPWFWVAVASAAASAIIVPLSLRRDRADGFRTVVRLPIGASR